jgi:hypothetical protein
MKSLQKTRSRRKHVKESAAPLNHAAEQWQRRLTRHKLIEETLRRSEKKIPDPSGKPAAKSFSQRPPFHLRILQQELCR